MNFLDNGVLKGFWWLLGMGVSLFSKDLIK